jgi:parvulin-like peptidyl-prolyl isomerase
MKLLILTISLTLLSFQTQEQQRTEAEAKKLIDSVYAKLMKGEDFTNLVTEYSEDLGSVKQGGVYNNVKKGQFTIEVESTAFSLKPNEISKPFKSKYGYNIVQLLNKQGDTIYSARYIIITYKK